MPVYNAGIFLRPAIDSILAQTCRDFEFVLVDDGGTDGSDAIMRTYDDPRIRILDHGPGRPNRGIPQSRNRALDSARGEFIAFLNHDDTCVPDRFTRQLAYLQAHPAIGMIGSAIDNIDADARPMSHQPFPESRLGVRWFGLLDCPLRQSSLMIRRECLESPRRRYDETFTYNSDYEFIERMTRVIGSVNLPETLTHYRKHATNTSRLRYAAFVDAGNRIALSAIAHELPGFPITLAEVAALRAVVLGYSLPSVPRSIALTKQAWRTYLDLFEAFRARHAADPEMSRLPAPSPASK